MSEYSKVMWSEGMFIQPQHFQQETRYLEQFIRRRCHVLRPHSWGLTHIEIDHELLATRHFALRHCAGIFEDGTPFSLSDGDGGLAPLLLAPGTRDATVYLTLPLRRRGCLEIAEATSDDSCARYQAVAITALDTHSHGGTPAEISVGKPRLRYRLGATDTFDGLAIAVARIADVEAATGARLDPLHSPPALSITSSSALANMLANVDGMLAQRGAALAGQFGADLGNAALSDLLILQTINRYRPQVRHLSHPGLHHPDEAFQLLLGLMGELATLSAPGHLPPDCGPYDHNDLEKTFTPLIAMIRRYLDLAQERMAALIPLADDIDGIRTGCLDACAMTRLSLMAEAAFILVVTAEVETEELMRRFPAHVKIGAHDQIHHLINAALPGVKLRALPVAPRHIPYSAGACYFECDRTGPLWRQVVTTESIALHVTSDFPGLRLELWAVRG